MFCISTIAPILFTLRDEVFLDDLVPFNNIGASILDNSTTLLVDAQSGERVPHWVDRDAFDLDFGKTDQPNMLILQVSMYVVLLFC